MSMNFPLQPQTWSKDIEMERSEELSFHPEETDNQSLVSTQACTHYQAMVNKMQ